jgi:hypothetical protein
MPTYEEVLDLAKRFSPQERMQLRDALSDSVHSSVEVEGADEVISGEEIAESDMALQDYLSGRDGGVSSEALKQKLFGGGFG